MKRHEWIEKLNFNCKDDDDDDDEEVLINIMPDINKLFGHIESIEAENKELKAKLEAIENNKVAEFSGKLDIDKNNTIYIPNSERKAEEIDFCESYTVTISKDKQ